MRACIAGTALCLGFSVTVVWLWCLGDYPTWRSAVQPRGQLRVERMGGARLRLLALGGQPLSIQAQHLEPIDRRVGPMRIVGMFDGVRLSGVRAQLPYSLRLVADVAAVRDDEIRFSGGVRIDHAVDGGVLFTSELVLEQSLDRLVAPAVAVFGPSGDRGGEGGRIVPSWSGTLYGALEAAK